MNNEENKIPDITSWRNGIEEAFLYESDLVERATLGQLKLKVILGMLGISGFKDIFYSISAPLPVFL